MIGAMFIIYRKSQRQRKTETERDNESNRERETARGGRQRETKRVKIFLCLNPRYIYNMITQKSVSSI